MADSIQIKLTVAKDQAAAFEKALKDLIEHDVLVGVPQEKAPRKSGAITNAALAYIHNNGSPSQNIPPRPFMEPGIKKASERISVIMRQTALAAMDGNKAKVRQGLESVGLLAQSGIRDKINEGPPPPLKARTIAARKRRGTTSTKPLVVTGQLRNAITYVIKKK